MNLGHWQWAKGDLREQQAQEFARGTEAAQPLQAQRSKTCRGSSGSA